MNTYADRQDNPILVIGSGNEECIICLDAEFQCDRKYLADYIYLAGGSGVNCTLRLVNAGHKVIPVLPLGRDAVGRNIRSLIAAQGRPNDSDKVNLFINSDHFFIPEAVTAKAVIIIDKNGHRTVFTERNQTSPYFAAHVENCIRFFRPETAPGTRIKSVLIGHIQADHPRHNPDHPGAITRHLIQSFGDRQIFTNLGHSQICMGIKFWEAHLKRVALFQLNISEIRQMFCLSGYQFSLYEIVAWLYERQITTVITMNRAGAIGIFNRNDQGIICSPGYNLDVFVDSTGAGDAFMAGMVSRLHGRDRFGIEAFRRAIEQGQVWAAYACTTLGASQGCPDQETIQAFSQKIRARHPDPPQVLSLKEAQTYIGSMLKKADV